MRNQWITFELSNIICRERPITYGIVQPGDFVKSGVPMIRSGDYSEGWVPPSEIMHVSNEIARPYQRSRVRAGDILMTVVGANTGTVVRVPEHLDRANISRASARLAVDANIVCPDYVEQFMKSALWKKQIYGALKAGAQPVVHLSDLGRFKLHAPEALIEQHKIAEILQTWDEAIDDYERLIDRLEKRFRATARRFFDPCHPTFHRRPNSWKECELGDVFAERTDSGEADDRLLSITMSGGVIDRDDVGRKDTSTEDKSSYKLILPGDIGYNTMRMWQGVSGLSTLRGIVSPAYTIVTPDNTNIAAKYAAHLFKSRRMVFDFERYSQGLTSDTWNLKFPAFSKIKVFLPPIALQHNQAELLDAMKEEIEVVQRKRDALSDQKRGLMQKLLTGEWRVPVDEATS